MLVLVRTAKMSVLRRYVVSVLSASALGGAAAAEESGALDKVTVTATRVEAHSYNVPASISSVSGDNFREASLGVNLADDMAEVPGLLARNRNNYAQDQQISIRGYGANSPFGIRGVRVYQDGMPASSPDGQGQVSQFNLDSASRVEVLRGPFSALYGNSAGGVIQIFTADGHDPTELRAGVAYGSFETLRATVNANGTVGDFGYNVGFTHFDTDGYRDHSAARNESFNAKLNYAINDANQLTFLANIISRPDSEDTLGLTQAQFNADPQQTDASAITFNTRKSLQQGQAGLVYDLTLTEHQSLRVLGYYGQRTVVQFQSIPVAVQTPVTSSGGVVDLEREYGGGDARWSWSGSLMNQPMSWVVGVTYDRQNERRRGYNNFVGTPPNQTLGVKGNLRRDENNIVYNFDEYVQGSWDFAANWSAMVGVRHSDIEFDSQDHYIVTGNPDDSGQLSYGATSPVAGLMYKPTAWLHAYASYGQGFQSPLGSELAYRADGVTGLNTNLKASHSDNAELGVKMQLATSWNIEAALFQALTDDEIVVNTNSGGRSTYQNSGRTRRRGGELSVDYQFASDWRWQVAYTYLDATYVDTYTTCIAAPCTAASPVNKGPVSAGNRLPGIPENTFYTAIRWGSDLGFYAAINFQYLSDIEANDRNTVAAPAYELVGANGGYRVEVGSVRLDGFVRVNNALDKDYVGSIIVNDGNSRFFETGSGLAVLVGINASWK
jgi:iron complex outermembrane receptor protein